MRSREFSCDRDRRHSHFGNLRLGRFLRVPLPSCPFLFVLLTFTSIRMKMGEDDGFYYFDHSAQRPLARTRK